jgi:hypothetical protein
MNNPEERLAVIEQKIDAMTKIVKRLQLYFLMTVIVSVLAILVPAIGLVWAIPQFMNTYSSALSGSF